MDKQITIAANTNPNPLRAIMYETSAPNVAVQAIDIPLPHNVSQQIVFTGLNDVSHWFRLYEVVGMVLGTQLSDSLIQPTVKSVYCDLPIELNVGVAPTDRITPAVNNYNGTVEFPQYAGKVAKTDYWVEQRGVGQLKDDEYTNNTDMGVTFGFKLTGTALFNDADTYFIKFRPIILVNPANFPNTIRIEPPHLIGNVGEPPFQNMWENQIFGFGKPAGFRKNLNNNQVCFSGEIVKSLYTGVYETMFVLPINYRPNVVIFKEICLGGNPSSKNAVLSIGTSGNVNIEAKSDWITAGAHICIEGLSFFID